MSSNGTSLINKLGFFASHFPFYFNILRSKVKSCVCVWGRGRIYIFIINGIFYYLFCFRDRKHRKVQNRPCAITKLNQRQFISILWVKSILYFIIYFERSLQQNAINSGYNLYVVSNIDYRASGDGVW